MNRCHRKWPLRLFLFVALIIVIGAALYLFVLPLYAAAQVRAILNDAGIKVATFSVRRVSLTQLEIADLDIGKPEWLDVDSIRIQYSISSLWNNRLKSIDLVGGRWSIRGGDEGIDWGYHLPPSRAAAALHDLPVDRLGIHDSTIALEWNGSAREIPVAASMSRTAPGKFDVSLQAGKASGGGEFDLTGDSPHGSLQATLPSTDIAEVNVLRDVFPRLRGLEMTGACAVEAVLRLADGRLDPLVTLSIEHAKLSHPSWPGSIDDVSGSIVFNSLAALSTPPHQQITIASATLGPTHITDAQITFTVQRPDAIDIEHASWSMGDLGQFTASPFAFNPRDPELKTELECRNVGLGPWLDLLTSGRANGQGTLEGRVQLSYQPSEGIPINVGVGDLHASPATGWIRTGDAQMLETMFQQSAADGSVSERWNEIKDRVIRALQDFQYSKFDVALEPEGDDTVCRLTTAGRGRQGADPQEIGSLTVNIHRFGYVLDNVLRGKSAFGSME